eukprot:m.231480 g.231480  ORF g.231480 m.231480 type:complete len:230 (-) comp18377_c0_seq1:116-805(-)
MADLAAMADFNTFEDFLDSQVAPIDLYYLEDEDVARQLVELGYRGNGEAVKREDFRARKLAAEALRNTKASNEPKPLAGSHPNVLQTPLITALAEREADNRNGRLITLIFIRHKNAKGQEISGYIDFAARMQLEDMEPYFVEGRPLLPRHTDISFYNWETQTAHQSVSPNLEVITDRYEGLLFKCKADRKVINVDPKAVAQDPTTTRIKIIDPAYTQVVLYDHPIRQKA